MIDYAAVQTDGASTFSTVLGISVVSVLRLAVLLFACHSLMAAHRGLAALLVVIIEPAYYVLFMAVDAVAWFALPIRSIVYPWAEEWTTAEVVSVFTGIYVNVFCLVAIHSFIVAIFLYWTRRRWTAAVAPDDPPGR